MKGRVPDRGGRPTEIEPPPPEMPSWQKRTESGGRGGGYAPQPQRQGLQQFLIIRLFVGFFCVFLVFFVFLLL